MQNLNQVLLALAITLTGLASANTFAVEYEQNNCLGPIIANHTTGTFNRVSMHKNANSVFLAPSNGWTAFDDRECVGALIGNIAGGCLRLDAGADRKIQCVTSRKNDRVAPRAVDIDATSESASAPATWPKANEYETDNCSGKMLHEHHGLSIGNVQMDDASHSVYLAKGTGFGPWHAWSDKEAAPGKNCVGFELGEMGGGCIKLDNFGPDRKRVRCVGGSAA